MNLLNTCVFHSINMTITFNIYTGNLNVMKYMIYYHAIALPGNYPIVDKNAIHTVELQVGLVN